MGRSMLRPYKEAEGGPGLKAALQNWARELCRASWRGGVVVYWP
jgi:hypothetical protein